MSPPRVRPPGPRGRFLAGNLMDYEDDRLGFLLRVRDRYGPVVAFDARTTIVNDAEAASEVLLDRGGAFAILGNLRAERVSEQQAQEALTARLGLNGGFRAGAVGHLVERTRTLTRAGFDAALGTSPAALDPLPLLEATLSRVVGEYYVGEDWQPVGEVIADLSAALDKVFGNPFALPPVVPSPTRLRVRRTYRAARGVIDALIDVRRRSRGGTDLVSALLGKEALAGASPQRVADIVIGSLLASHRIPALGAVWSLLEVARSPGVQELLVRAGREGAGATPSAARLTTAVVMESTRLHPPTWLLSRTVLRPVKVGGYELGPGERVVISPYVIHRDPAIFEEPAVFDVARWLRGGVPRGYLAFGRGLHGCPGRDLGIMLMTSAVSALVDAYSLAAVDVRDVVVADPTSSLVPVERRLVMRRRAPQAVVRDFTSSTR